MKKVLLFIVAILAFNLSTAQEIDTSKYDGVYTHYYGILKIGTVEIDNGSVMFHYDDGVMTDFGFVFDSNSSEGVFTPNNELYGKYTYKIFTTKRGKVKGEITMINKGLITKSKLKKTSLTDK